MARWNKVWSSLFAAIFLLTAGTPAALAGSVEPGASPQSLQVPTTLGDSYLWPSWAVSSINTAVLWQIVQGYSINSSTVGATVYQGNLIFGPNSNVTQGQFAAMVARAMGNALPDPTQNLDAPLGLTDPTQWYYPDVQALAADGVLASWEFPGGFYQGSTVNRGQAGMILGAALSYYGVNCRSSGVTFNDLSSGYPGFQDIQKAAACGVIQGYGNGSFGPGDNVTRAQAATLLVRFVGALPGARQLNYQTPELNAYFRGVGPMTGYWAGVGLGGSAVNLQATSGDTPAGVATTAAQLAAAPDTAWWSIHLWLATGNWIALAEGKYTAQEASYIANCGLEPWQAGMLAAALTAYAGTRSDLPLVGALAANNSNFTGIGPNLGGNLSPVTRIGVDFPGQPFTGNGYAVTGSWLVTFANGKTVSFRPTMHLGSNQTYGFFWSAWRVNSVDGGNY